MSEEKGGYVYAFGQRRWEGPPPDPVAQGAAKGIPNRNSAVGFWLHHQSHMPLGPHAGKIMQRVPAAYLLQLYDRAETQRDRSWFPVWSYIDRHLEEIRTRAATEKPAPTRNTVDFGTTLVSLARANASTYWKERCELCCDRAHEKCECDPAKRAARNQARREKQK